MILAALAFLKGLSGLSGILSSVLNIATLVFKTLLDLVVWYCKQFWQGLGVIFHNLSTLAVLLAVLLAGGWYFKTWDNDKVLKQCITTCPNPVEPKKYYHPIKYKIIEKVAPQKIITKAPPKVEPKPFNPFGGSNGG